MRKSTKDGRVVGASERARDDCNTAGGRESRGEPKVRETRNVDEEAQAKME